VLSVPKKLRCKIRQVGTEGIGTGSRWAILPSDWQLDLSKNTVLEIVKGERVTSVNKDRISRANNKNIIEEAAASVTTKKMRVAKK
jgi:hypothetical protein